MSSSFTGGGPDFTAAGGFAGRSVAMNNPQVPYRSQLHGILMDPVPQIVQRRPDLMGKRSLAEFQVQQQQQNSVFQQQQQQKHGLGVYLRNVKQRTFQHALPISPLSPVDFSGSVSPVVSSISSSTNSSLGMTARYGLPILQQLRSQPVGLGNGNSILPSYSPNFSSVSYQNMVTNRVLSPESGPESEKKMMNRLQELEKQLLDDNDEDEGDAVSVVTNSEWSETIQNLISPTQKPISPSPTSSSSSCSSSSASPPIACAKQSLMEAAAAISEGKPEVAAEILSLLNQVANLRGTPEQRLTAHMASALRLRVNPTEYYPPPVADLYTKEQALSTQMLYEISPCFKLGFMAANLAILEATSDQQFGKLHVVDFDVGQGSQYVHLIHALAARKADKPTTLKITTFMDVGSGGDERLKVVGDLLKAEAKKVGVPLNFNVLCTKIHLSLENLVVEPDEALAMNFAFRLYKLPDESVTTENLRDDLLRRVKGLSPTVVTVVEQEMNGNTAPFTGRVAEACSYYGALFDSLDATIPNRELPERLRVEEGLGRRAANSVACEGRDRVERCEVFGKWRARMGMAGFGSRPLSQNVSDSLRAGLNSGTRGNPGFTVKEENGGICIGWKGRTLTVASAWR